MINDDDDKSTRRADCHHIEMTIVTRLNCDNFGDIMKDDGDKNTC